MKLVREFYSKNIYEMSEDMLRFINIVTELKIKKGLEIETYIDNGRFGDGKHLVEIKKSPDKLDGVDLLNVFNATRRP